MDDIFFEIAFVFACVVGVVGDGNGSLMVFFCELSFVIPKTVRGRDCGRDFGLSLSTDSVLREDNFVDLDLITSDDFLVGIGGGEPFSLGGGGVDGRGGGDWEGVVSNIVDFFGVERLIGDSS